MARSTFTPSSRKSASAPTSEPDPTPTPVARVRRAVTADITAAAHASALGTQRLSDDGDDPEGEVAANVPRGFTLTDDDGKQYRYEAGKQNMRRSHAEHFYAAANGVTLLD